jgi:hypothetical protein
MRLLSLSILVSQFVILALFAILTGASTAEARYSDLGIPYGNEIIFIAALYLLLVGLIYRRTPFSLTPQLVFLILLLFFLWTWGKLSSAVTSREFSQFDYFFLLSIVGLLIGTSKARNTIETGVKISAIVISVSVLLIGLSPDIVGALTIYDPTRLKELGTGSGFFLKNSGIILNNNSLGSVVTAIFAYLVFINQTSSHQKKDNKILVLLLISIILSGNATGSVLCLVLYFYSVTTRKKISYKYFSYAIPAILASFLVSIVISMTFDSSYVEYKVESFLTKYNIFIDNLYYFFGNFSGVIFGKKGEAELSESTLVDFLYYFGAPGIAVLFILFLSGSFLAPSSAYHSFPRTQLWPIYLVLLILLLVQNSVFLPPVCFVFGALLSSSTEKKIASYHQPNLTV